MKERYFKPRTDPELMRGMVIGLLVAVPFWLLVIIAIISYFSGGTQ